ncbi:DUF2798 domain-containing protein [Sphingobacterium thalpophilum]|uniref:DUF2798 domain-containing protein n=1 Tax=Sphingobacterium thalpophilum TaxID=259 RepID=UPI003DA68CE7
MVNFRKDGRHKMVSTFFVVLPTTFIMSVVSSVMKARTVENWTGELLKSWLISLPIVYVCVLLLLPLANKLTGKLVDRKVNV